ncbi:response regulator [Carboxylicivirga sp. RSCT41]|uniref:response regulator n=1 Tax=Carboxylicivirga agarovorans TaxID=3417570 RepID=UPI003D3320C5
MNLKVAIVDDHPLFSDGLNYYLSSIDLVEEVKLYANGKEFMHDIMAGEKPDLVFMDINMPVLDGIDTTRSLRKKSHEIKVIAISSLDSLEHIELMIEAGANGYITKSLTAEEIETAINAVLKGDSYFSSNVIATLTQKNIQRALDAKIVIESISEREMQVLKLICLGDNRYEISSKLYISERTVDKHRQSLLQKTDCENSVQLLLFCIKNRIVDINKR